MKKTITLISLLVGCAGIYLLKDNFKILAGVFLLILGNNLNMFNSQLRQVKFNEEIMSLFEMIVKGNKNK